MERINTIIWAVLALFALVAVIFVNATWHLVTLGICTALYFAHKSESKRNKPIK